MKYCFIDQYCSEFRVTKMCRALGVSRSGYYGWKKQPQGKRRKDEERLLIEIKESYRKSKGNYGSPRIADDLRDKGLCCGKNRVARIMKVNGIKAKATKKFKATTNSKHNLPVAENLLNQDFTAAAPNAVWVSDITYLSTLEGWLYLAVIIDLYSRQVVGWAMSNRLTADFVIRALYQAIGRRRPPTGCIFHSDRGVQYACKDFRKVLEHYKFRQSMSKKGDCYDNGVPRTLNGGALQEMRVWPLGIGLQDRVSNYVELPR